MHLIVLFLVLQGTASAPVRLAAYDAVTSERIALIDVPSEAIDARLFEAFKLAYATGADNVDYARVVTVLVGGIPVSARVSIAKLDNEKPAMYFRLTIAGRPCYTAPVTE